MITGSAKIKIDDKGRLAFPSRFRDFLASFSDAHPILTYHPHQCLSLYSPDRFAEIEREIMEMGNINFWDTHLQEIIIGCAETVALDNAGRLMVQNHLRERASIRGEVLLFGVGDSIRIWAAEMWNQRHEVFLSHIQEEGMSESWRKIRL